MCILCNVYVFVCYSVYRLCIILCTVYVLFCVPFMYYSVYCLCVILCTVYVFVCYSVYLLCIILCTVYVYSVYSITATGCQPICSLLIIIIIIYVPPSMSATKFRYLLFYFQTNFLQSALQAVRYRRICNPFHKEM